MKTVSEQMELARKAQAIVNDYTQEQIDEICLAIGWEVYEDENIAKLAKMAVEETGYGNGTWQQFMVLSQNSGSTNNLTYTFLASEVEKIDTQHLDATEDIAVRLLTPTEVKQLLLDDIIKQSLMAAPLWKYFALKVM